MKLTFLEYAQKRDYEANLLAEKQIIYGNNESYGQIVFLAGGAGSGKGFAADNFMHREKFKVLDVDKLKSALIKIDSLNKFSLDDLLKKYGDNIPESDMKIINDEIVSKGLSTKDLNLKNPRHVYVLHVLVRATGAKDKIIDILLNADIMLSADQTVKLPNIIFDTTLSDMGDVNKYVPRLLALGYESKNIHITWVLTNYEVAIVNNAKRPRVVPDDIMLKTHTGAARTIYDLVKKGLPSTVDGAFYVILNNPEATVYLKDPKTGKEYKNFPKYSDNRNDIGWEGDKVITGFTYLTLKLPGKPLTSEASVKKELFGWIKANVPKGALDTAEIDKQL